MLTARKALQNSAILWFATALVGQWLFAFYVIAFFGTKLLKSGLPGFSETHLTGGYVAGDVIGNLVLAAHILIAFIVHGGGPLQLVPQIRNRFPVFHHIVGRSYLFAALISGLSGLYIMWVRGSNEGWIADISNTITTVLIFTFGAMTLRHAMARNIAAHRRWALRFFMILSAFWFLRVGIYGADVFASALGVEFKSIAKRLFATMHIAKIVVPLGVLEIYFWGQSRAGPRGKAAVAGLVLAAAVLTGVGVYAVATTGWLPKIFG